MSADEVSDKKTKTQKNYLSSRPNFSRSQLSFFILIFAVIGGYFLIRSFAASPLLTTIQAESLAPPVAAPASSTTSTTTTTTSKSTTTTPTAKPAIPSGLKATAGNGSVTLTWNANPASDQVDTYQVYYGTVASFSSFSIFIDSITHTSYTVTGLTNGKTYYFKISAHNSLGYGPWSASPVGATPTSSTTTTPSTTDLALNKPATASSVESSLSTLVASNAFDGNTATRWSSNYSDPQWVEVDLGSTQTISSVVITWTTTANSWEIAYAKAYQIQTSNDNKTWTTIYSTTTGTNGTSTLSVNGSGRYLRMYGTQRASKYGYSLWEMAVYGPGTTTSAAPVNVITDSTASNGQALEFTGNTTVSGQFNLSGAATSITATARGTACSGTGATMVVSIDGTQVLTTTTSSSSWTAYSANVNLAAGSHSLSIGFTNASTTSTCARDLFVDKVDVYGATAPPTPAPTVAISVLPTSVTAGTSATLTWSSTNTNASNPCTASGSWSGGVAASGSQPTGALNQTSTYTLKCTGPGGTTSNSATVTVTATPPPPPPPSGTVHGMYDSDNYQANFTADWPGIAAQDINTLILPAAWTSNLQTLKAAGDKAWVTAGYWDDGSQSFSESQSQAVSEVTSACALGVVSGIYVADEPSAGQSTIKTRAAALKAACPSAQTIMAYYDAGSVASWKGVTDAIALDIYPSRYSFNDSLITQLAAAADAAGIPYYGVVGAFTDGTANYPLPTAAQLSAMFSTWEATHELGWLVYSWGATGGATSTQLQNQPSLLSVIKSNADQ